MKLHTLHEDIESKMPQLVKQVKNIYKDEHHAANNLRIIADYVDPTGKRAVYMPWVAKQLKYGNIIWPEDAQKLQSYLMKFHEMKGSRNFRGEKDISRYRLFNNLADAVDTHEGIDLKSKAQQTKETKVKGAKVVATSGEWKLIQIISPEAAVIYGKGTRWCTSEIETAREYLDGGPLYIGLKNNTKEFQITHDAEQFMDVQDYEYKIGPEDIEDILEILQIIGYNSKGNVATHIDYKNIKDLDQIIDIFNIKDTSVMAQTILQQIVGPDYDSTYRLAEEDQNTVPYSKKMLSRINNGFVLAAYAGRTGVTLNKNTVLKIIKTKYGFKYFLHLNATGKKPYLDDEILNALLNSVMGYDESVVWYFISLILKRRWPEYEKALENGGMPITDHTFDYMLTYNVPKNENIESRLISMLKNAEDGEQFWYDFELATNYFRILNGSRWEEIEPILADKNIDAKIEYIKSSGYVPDAFIITTKDYDVVMISRTLNNIRIKKLEGNIDDPESAMEYMIITQEYIPELYRTFDNLSPYHHTIVKSFLNGMPKPVPSIKRLENKILKLSKEARDKTASYERNYMFVMLKDYITNVKDVDRDVYKTMHRRMLKLNTEGYIRNGLSSTSNIQKMMEKGLHKVLQNKKNIWPVKHLSYHITTSLKHMSKDDLDNIVYPLSEYFRKWGIPKNGAKDDWARDSFVMLAANLEENDFIEIKKAIQDYEPDLKTYNEIIRGFNERQKISIS